MQSILCAVDFHPHSVRALQHAAAIARCSHSPLTVVHATHFEVPPYFTESQQEALRRLFEDNTTLARQALRRFVEEHVPEEGVRTDLLVEDGVPAEVIARAAAKLAPSITVLGTHSEKGLSRVLMGSVAEQLLRSASFPVLTVAESAASAPFPPEKILVAVNHTPAAQEGVRVAAELAFCLDAELTLLQVDEPGAVTSSPDVCEWVPEGIRQHCSIRALTHRGEAGREILQLAHSGGYGMIVVGARHRLFFDSTVLGGTTVQVIRHASVPVLTVFEPRSV